MPPLKRARARVQERANRYRNSNGDPESSLQGAARGRGNRNARNRILSTTAIETNAP